MTARKLCSGIFALALASMPLSLFSQDVPQSDHVQEWLIEIHYIQMQLAPLEERALQEPDIAAQRTAVGDAVIAAMVEADPTIAPKLERLQAIATEAESPQIDKERMDALGAEAQDLQPAIRRARALALERPELAAQVAGFKKALCERMALLAPEAYQMVSRYQELQRLINASLRQGASPIPVIGG